MNFYSSIKSPPGHGYNTVFIRVPGGILLPLCGPSEVRQSTLDSVCPEESDSLAGTWSLRSDFPLEQEANAKFILKVFLVYLKLRGMKNLRVTYSHNVMYLCFLQNKP